MTRGTTPTIIISTNSNPAEFASMYVTFKQGSIELTKGTDQLRIEGNRIQVFLDQNDTLMFKANGSKAGSVMVQLRAITSEGIAVASNIKSIPVSAILKEGVIT